MLHNVTQLLLTIIRYIFPSFSLVKSSPRDLQLMVCSCIILSKTGVSLSFVQEVSGVFQPGIFSFSYDRKYEGKTKTAGQIDGYVSFTAGQFAQCPALNEPPGLKVFCCK